MLLILARYDVFSVMLSVDVLLEAPVAKLMVLPKTAIGTMFFN